MMINTKIHTTVLLSLIFSISGQSAITSTPSCHNIEPVRRDSIGLRELTIEASKDQIIYKKLPASISLITGYDMVNMGIDQMTDLNTLAPNLMIHEQGTRLSSPIYIRGVGSKLNQPSVGMYVDNVPYYSKGMMNFDWYDIHRIEVLRGPQGTEFGRNAMGGIINVTTLSPLNFQGITIHAKGGMYGDYRLGAGYYSQPSEHWAFSATGNMIRRAGYRINEFNGDHPDKLSSEGFRSRLIYHDGIGLSVENILSVEHSHQYGFPYASYDPKGETIGQINYNDEGGYQRHSINDAVIIRSHRDRINWQSTSAIQYFNGDYSIDQDLSPKSIYNVKKGEEQWLFSQDLSFSKKVGHSLSVLLGLNAFYRHTKSDVDVHIATKKINSLKDYNNPIWGIALYHQTIVKDVLINGLDLTLGVRADMEKARQHYKHAVVTSKGTKVLDDSDLSPHNSLIILPKVALTYKLNNHNLYAVVAEGYKTGGYNISFDTKEHASFKPEKSWNYEFGVKSSLFNHQLFTELSFFYIDWHQQQIYKTLKEGAMLLNADHTVSKGVEISLRTGMISGYRFMLGYGATDAQYITNRQDEHADYSGHSLPYVPHHTVQALLSKQFELPHQWFLRQIVCSAKYNGMGKIYYDDANKLVQPFYQTVDLRCSFRRPGMNIDLWANNITNTHYLSHLFSIASAHFAQEGLPLRCGVTLSLNVNR